MVKNDLQKANLKGKVKSVNSTTYRVSEEDGIIKKKIYSINIEFYNELGNEIEFKQLHDNGDLFLITKYDNKGNKTTYKSNGDIHQTYSKIIDKEGQIVIKTVCGDFVNYYSYDEIGNLIKLITHTPDGRKLIERIYYKYDDKGRVLYKIDKGLHCQYSYEYDVNNNIIKEIEHNPFGMAIRKFVYEVDSYKNWIIKKQLYYGKTLEEITEREIEYY